MNSIYKFDKQRFNGGGEKHAIHFIKILRLRQSSKNRFLQLIYNRLLKYYYCKYGLEISSRCKIGKGLFLGHAFNITINPDSVIGDYCNIHKGVVIGQENRGKRKGVPVIGNRVWIGVNAAIVGQITIGDDVLIAPNSYVNCDIPSHSIVFGNPCIIKHKDNAVDGYINIKQ